MRGRVIAVCALSGCNWLYGLDSTSIRDAGIDAPPDALPPNCRVLLPSTVEQDTYLVDAQQHGVRPANGVGFDVDLVDELHPGLFKFFIGGIAAGEVVSAVSMNVVVVDRADQCGAGCGACPVHGGTRFRMYWNRGDWVDDTATATRRTVNRSWEQPFAEGPSDRSPLVAETALAPGFGATDLVIAMDAARVTPLDPAWIADGFLTIQVRADAPETAPIAIAADDRDESSCADGAAKAVLTATVCTP